MKTVKKGKKIKRVSSEEAGEMIKEGWKYCSKSEWREKVRDKPKPIITLRKNAKRKTKA